MRAPLRYLPLVLLFAGAAACGSSKPNSAPPSSTTTTGPSTASISVATAPSTTAAPWRATTPQSTPDGAAALLVSDWSRGNRAAAAAIASPAAVSALFVAAYPGPALALDRGCGQADPEICTYGPNGGANPDDAIYQIAVLQGAGGWYVSAVTVLS